jgi:hypothetical protein
MMIIMRKRKWEMEDQKFSIERIKDEKGRKRAYCQKEPSEENKKERKRNRNLKTKIVI